MSRTQTRGRRTRNSRQGRQSRRSRRRIAAIGFVLGLILILMLGSVLLRGGYRRYYSSAYPLEYRDLIEDAAREFALPPSLVCAVIHTESSFDAQALSSAGAKGLMQITDNTFLWAQSRLGEKGRYTADDLYDPTVNIRYGACVLSLLRERFTETETVLAAYNAGQGRVAEWLADPARSPDGVKLTDIPYPETEAYVYRVLQAQKQYQAIYSIE